MSIDMYWDRSAITPLYIQAQKYYEQKKYQLLEYLQKETQMGLERDLEQIKTDLITELNKKYEEARQVPASQIQYTSKLFFDEVKTIVSEVDFSIPIELETQLKNYIDDRTQKYNKKLLDASQEYHRSEDELREDLKKMRRNLSDYIKKYLEAIFTKQAGSALAFLHGENAVTGAYFNSSDQIKHSFINSVMKGYVQKKFGGQLIDDVIEYGRTGYSRLLKTNNELYVNQALEDVFSQLGMYAAATGQVKREAKNTKLPVEIGSDALLFILDDRTKAIQNKLQNILANGGKTIYFGTGWDSQSQDLVTKSHRFTKELTNAQVRIALGKSMGVNAKAWADFAERSKNKSSGMFEQVLRGGGMTLGSKTLPYKSNNAGGKGTQPYKDNLKICANYVKEILGIRNILFVTGTNFYFMDDFIQKMIDNKLFIQIHTRWDQNEPNLHYRYWVVDDLSAEELNYNKWRVAHSLMIF